MAGVRQFMSRLLGQAKKPTAPAASTFGVGAERLKAEKRREDEYDLEVAKAKGTIRGT